jgi:hypothetical protein
LDFLDWTFTHQKRKSKHTLPLLRRVINKACPHTKNFRSKTGKFYERSFVFNQITLVGRNSFLQRGTMSQMNTNTNWRAIEDDEVIRAVHMPYGVGSNHPVGNNSDVQFAASMGLNLNLNAPSVSSSEDEDETDLTSADENDQQLPSLSPVLVRQTGYVRRM